jgi:hypothetical protein
MGLNLRDIITVAVNSYKEDIVDKQEAVNSILKHVEDNYIQKPDLSKISVVALKEINEITHIAFEVSVGKIKSIELDS